MSSLDLKSTQSAITSIKISSILHVGGKFMRAILNLSSYIFQKAGAASSMNESTAEGNKPAASEEDAPDY